MNFTTRFLRPRKAAAYLDVNVDYFNKHIRPGLIEIPVGERGVRFDVLDLDAWADDYKHRYGRRPNKGNELCQKNQSCQGSSFDSGTGKSINALTESAYAKARAKLTTQKRSGTPSNVLTKSAKTRAKR